MGTPVIDAPKGLEIGKHQARANLCDDGKYEGVVLHVNEGHVTTLGMQYGGDKNKNLVDPIAHPSVMTTTLPYKFDTEEDAIAAAQAHADALNKVAELIRKPVQKS